MRALYLAFLLCASASAATKPLVSHEGATYVEADYNDGDSFTVKVDGIGPVTMRGIRKFVMVREDPK